MKRVAVVGGVERTQQVLEARAGELGWKLDYHSGHMEGQGQARLDACVARADLVVAVTGVNSHGAVKSTRALCTKYRKPFVLKHSVGPSALADILRSHA